MLPALLAQIGIPILVEILTAGLKKIDNPVAQGAAEALETLQGAVNGGQISDEQMAEANRHAETIAEMKIRENQTALEQINESLRAEVGSSDPYVRRMRPTFGYLMAFTWAAQMFGLAYVVIFETEKAAAVLESMEALSAIWAVGLSVLGIYVYKRSEEKKASGPPSPLSGLLGRNKESPPLPAKKPAYND